MSTERAIPRTAGYDALFIDLNQRQVHVRVIVELHEMRVSPFTRVRELDGNLRRARVSAVRDDVPIGDDQSRLVDGKAGRFFLTAFDLADDQCHAGIVRVAHRRQVHRVELALQIVILAQSLLRRGDGFLVARFARRRDETIQPSLHRVRQRGVVHRLQPRLELSRHLLVRGEELLNLDVVLGGRLSAAPEQPAGQTAEDDDGAKRDDAQHVRLLLDRDRDALGRRLSRWSFRDRRLGGDVDRTLRLRSALAIVERIGRSTTGSGSTRRGSAHALSQRRSPRGRRRHARPGASSSSSSNGSRAGERSARRIRRRSHRSSRR